jgi:hypothetical protein
LIAVRHGCRAVSGVSRFQSAARNRGGLPDTAARVLWGQTFTVQTVQSTAKLYLQ